MSVISHSAINGPQGVFNIPELITHILEFLPEGDLIRLQRVCSVWRSLITTAPSLRRITFDCNVISTAEDVPRVLNTFVISRLRWSPMYDVSQVNSFDCVPPKLRPMAAKEASWKTQSISWPPLTVILTRYKAGFPRTAVSDVMRDLCLRCRSSEETRDNTDSDAEPMDTNADSDSDSDGNSDRTMDINAFIMDDSPIVRYVDDFPHNAGKTCTGITVLDWLYGLQKHYDCYERIDLLGELFQLRAYEGHNSDRVGKFHIGYSESGALPELEITLTLRSRKSNLR